MGSILALLGVAALAALLWWLLRPKDQNDSGGFDPDSGSGGGGQSGGLRQSEYDRTAQAAVDSGSINKVSKILNSGNKDLVEKLCSCAGVAHNPLADMSKDSETVRKIASRISRPVLEILNVAASENVVELDLKKSADRIPVQHPTSDIEPEKITDYAQLTEILPEQLLEDDDQFCLRLAQQDLTVLQSYENQTKTKILYIMLDGSGSMDDEMDNGLPRHVWARGVVIKLLYEAINGEAKYFLRVFDNESHELMKATTPEEASRLIDLILRTGFTGGGTNIYGGVSTAVNDIRSKGGDFSQAEIVLVTDGDDPSMDSKKTVQKLLGEDIRLHSILIGAESKPLRAVSATYKSIG